jgi:hypothetical protein
MESGTVSSRGDFLSLTEAATRKGVHYQTVRRAIARGHLVVHATRGAPERPVLVDTLLATRTDWTWKGREDGQAHSHDRL